MPASVSHKIMRDFSCSQIDFLRHGKPEGGEIFRGHTDVVMSAEGYLQMQSAINQSRVRDGDPDRPWDIIISSPLLRCQTFAQDLARQLLQQDAIIFEEFREVSFGDWDGQSFEQIQQNQPEAFKAFSRDPLNCPPPQSEPLVEFEQRIAAGLNRLQRDFPGKKILLLCHGGVIRMAMAQLLQLPQASLVRIDVPYACMTRFKVYSQAEQALWPQLVFHG